MLGMLIYGYGLESKESGGGRIYSIKILKRKE